MLSMTIGSGDTNALLAGIATKTHQKLLQRFVSGVMPHYNAKASPIDAFRTGAILEDRYFLTLPDSYFAQYKVHCKEQNVLRSSIDFAKIESGELVDFDELKSCNFNDFLNFEPYRNDNDGGLKYIIQNSAYRHNYQQIQFQLYCTGLQAANLVYLASYSDDDEINYARNIKDNEYIKFRIERDEIVINQIRKRAAIFQTIKDYYTK